MARRVMRGYSPVTLCVWYPVCMLTARRGCMPRPVTLCMVTAIGEGIWPGV